MRGEMSACCVLGLVLAATVCALESDSVPTADKVVDVYYPSLNWSDNFDWRLLKELSSSGGNILVSPISLKIVLALLYEGSSGATEREFQNVLQFMDKKAVQDEYRDVLTSLQVSERNEYVLNLGTRIFLDSEIQPKQKFASLARESFKTDIELTNFTEPTGSSQAINSWVEKLTNGRISKLVRADDIQDAIMLIANAVYFKGNWLNRFPKALTAPGKFYLQNEDNFLTINVPYMTTQGKFYFVESPSYDAKIIRLPYKGGRYSMFIVLPNSKGGLTSLLRKINLQTLKNLLYLMDKRVVKVTLPKFKFDYQIRLSSTLKKFGLMQMFENTASFPGITLGNNTLLRMLQVSDVIQKSGIELDEEGSVVYAATGLNIGNKIGENEAVFDATHPFVFFIEEEKGGNILFVGKLENPLSEDPLPLVPIKAE